MTTPSIDIKDILVANGVGTLAGSSGWSIHITKMPEFQSGITPHTVIGIFDTGGQNPDAKFILDFPTLNILVRGPIGDYQSAANKQEEIKETLLGIPATVVNTTKYVGIWQVGSIIFVHWDESNRPVLSSNWRIAREEASSGHRSSLS